jgi:hypothetical protein
MVGDKRISNVREMVTEILRAQLTPWQDDQPRFQDPPQEVRVIYHTHRVSNTQHLTLTRADVDELSALVKNLYSSGQGPAAKSNVLPEGWSLEYDDGIRGGGNARTWKGQMADDLASLEVVPAPTDRQDTSWRNENYEFTVLSSDGKSVGTIAIRRDDKRGELQSIILKPGAYSLRYRRAGGNNLDNFRIHSGPFGIDLNKPGMYRLRFVPKLGQARISGALGGCYALNFESIETAGPSVIGMFFQNAAQQYAVNGLPAGRYRLSAVSQMDGDNVFISQAEAAVTAGKTVAVDMPAPPTGTCSLRGKLLGTPRQYETPWPTSPRLSGKWYILIRNAGSAPIEQTNAYEALTMDSRYVIRGSRIVQETEDTAAYAIAGIAPGQYTVTAIEHPSFGGCTIERQQSRLLTLEAGEEAILDFDLTKPTIQ